MPALIETVERLFLYERFCSRMIKVDGLWFFELLDDVKAEDHIQVEEFSGAEDELFKQVEQLALKPLRVASDRPAFEFVLLRNRGLGPSAVVARINHAIGDGISLAKLIQNVFRDIDGKELPAPQRFTRREKAFKPSLSNPLNILSSLFKVLATPNSAFDTEIGLMGPDRAKLKFSGQRTIVRVPVLKLPFIKAIKNAAHVTLNDVIYAAMAGAIHRHREAAKEPAIVDEGSASKVQTRALLPVAIPRAQNNLSRALRNKWSFASVPIPIGVKGSLERLMVTHQSLEQLKNSPIIIVSNTFEKIVGNRLPWEMTKQVAYDTFVRHSMVFSNVPGPDMKVSFAGQEVTGLYMVYLNLLPQVGALSLNNRLYMCMVVDPEVLGDAQALGGYVVEELKDMAARLELKPSDDDIFA